VTIRRAENSDYAAYVRLFAELAIPDPVPTEEKFVSMQVSQMWVACGDDADVRGYVTMRPYGATAHVIQLAVDSKFRGKRIGEQLLEHVRCEARAAGCTRWYLNVKRDNAPALRLYERVGMTVELESVAMSIKWDKVPPATPTARLAHPDDDREICIRYNILAERLAMFRARDFTLITLRDEMDGIIGFAAFAPSFPGAASFCAMRSELAADLLAAIRPHAKPEFDFVRVTVEGDRTLADAVLALGAELTFELLRLSSPL